MILATNHNLNIENHKSCFQLKEQDRKTSREIASKPKPLSLDDIIAFDSKLANGSLKKFSVRASLVRSMSTVSFSTQNELENSNSEICRQICQQRLSDSPHRNSQVKKKREYCAAKPRVDSSPDLLIEKIEYSGDRCISRGCLDKYAFVKTVRLQNQPKPPPDVPSPPLDELCQRGSSNEDSIISADSFLELPDDVKKLVIDARLDEELVNEHFPILCNILHFRTRRQFAKSNRPSSSVTAIKTTYDIPTRFNYSHEDLIIDNIDPTLIYTLHQEIGRGGYGHVFCAQDMSRKKWAVKVVQNSKEREKKHTFYEISLMKFCQHPNIVKLQRAYAITNSAWIVMEYMEGGPLSEAAKRHPFEEHEIAYVAVEVLKAISYLHHHKIVHRDLKSANIMLSINGFIKLIDLGLCADLSENPNRTEMVGSPFWMPPEMILYLPHDYKCDIWSFAISLLELANGAPPHYSSSIRAMFKTATEGCSNFLNQPEKWSNTFKDFLLLSLHPDPVQRASAHSLTKHPFLKIASDQRAMENVLATLYVMKKMELFNLT